jgi:hypothetical protein
MKIFNQHTFFLVLQALNILITQNTEQVLRISELLSVIQKSYIYGNHGNFKIELTLPVHSCYQLAPH